MCDFLFLFRLQIYTWQDATLRELTALVRDVNPETRRKGTYFDFALVSPEPFGPGYRMREIGVTCSGQRNADDGLSLAQAKFTIGDYMDINITPPNRVPQQRRRPYWFTIAALRLTTFIEFFCLHFWCVFFSLNRFSPTWYLQYISCSH